MDIRPRMPLPPIVALQHIILLISVLSPPHVAFCSNVPTMATGIHLLHGRSCAVFRGMGQANAPCEGYGHVDPYMAVTWEQADHGQMMPGVEKSSRNP